MARYEIHSELLDCSIALESATPAGNNKAVAIGCVRRLAKSPACDVAAYLVWDTETELYVYEAKARHAA